jgi:AcrR family transcriptional regulator
MHDIAAAAGLSSGAIYTWFASKEALFLAAFAALVADEEDALVAAITAERPRAERIRLAMDDFLEVAAARPQDDVRGAGPGFLLHAWANAGESPSCAHDSSIGGRSSARWQAWSSPMGSREASSRRASTRRASRVRSRRCWTACCSGARSSAMTSMPPMRAARSTR